MPFKFKDNTALARIHTRQQAINFVTRKALEVERIAKLSMKGGGKPHVPSSPGEPPHVDEGRLRSSITHEIGGTRNVVEARVGTNVKYGRFLELGTRHILPRPWLRPAIMQILD